MRSPQRRDRYVIIFDLDGTLYALRGGSYRNSPLRRRVLRNAQRFIVAKRSMSAPDARRTLERVQRRYGEDISIGLERSYGIDRYEYFDAVWNIPARGIVASAPYTRKILRELRRSFVLALVSDAPHIWVTNVLSALRVQEVFGERIFSGEGDQRKGFGNAFSSVARRLKVRPRHCIVVGDQERTDIVPAKRLGMRAVFVHRTRRSRAADANVTSIRELPAVLRRLAAARRA